MRNFAAILGTISILAGHMFHAGFKSALPAPNSTVASPAKISITFTEAVMAPPISTFSVLKADSTVATTVTVAYKTGDKTTIEGTLAKPLAPGKYIVKW